MQLSPRMKEAIEDLKANGQYRKIVLKDWAFWESVKDRFKRNIRTDTMKALESRKIVKITSTHNGKYANLI